MKALLKLWEQHGTKVIGYLATGAGAVSVMDPKLVGDLLGPNALRWCILISGVLTVMRGHGNTKRSKDSAAGQQVSQ